MIDDIWQVVNAIALQATKLIPADDPVSVDVKVDLDGRRLTGTVPGVRGNVLTTVTYSKVNPRHRLAAWVRLLALLREWRRLRGDHDRPRAVRRALLDVGHGRAHRRGRGRTPAAGDPARRSTTAA